jgi:hypothetical protein
MKNRLTILAAVAAMSALPASAQNVKPGLWEVSNKMTTASGQLEKAMAEMQKQMAGMPPEQRKMMEDMLSKQGVAVAAGAGGAGGNLVAKMCLTKDMIAQNQMPIQQLGDCTSTRGAMAGKTMKMSFTCTKPPSSGEGEITFNSDTSYSMKMKMNSSASGKPETMNVDATGRWLGADCGSIKPVTMPAPAR